MKRANTEEGNSSKEEGEAKRPRIEEDEKEPATVRGVLLKRNDLVVEVDVVLPHETLCVQRASDMVVYRRSDNMVAYVRDQRDAGKIITEERMIRFNAFAMLVLDKYFPGVKDEPLPIDGPVLLLGRDGGSLTVEQLVDVVTTGASLWPDPNVEYTPMACERARDKQEEAPLLAIYREPEMERMPTEKTWTFVGYDDRSDDAKWRHVWHFTPADSDKAAAVFRAYSMAARVPGHVGVLLDWLDTAELEDKEFFDERMAIVKTLLGKVKFEERATYGQLNIEPVPPQVAGGDRPHALLYYDATTDIW